MPKMVESVIVKKSRQDSVTLKTTSHYKWSKWTDRHTHAPLAHCSKRNRRQLSKNKKRKEEEKRRFLLRRCNRHRRSRGRSNRRLSSSGGIRSGSNGSIALLRIQHGLQLGRGLEARVVRVLLVKVVVGLGLQLGGQVLEDAGDEGVDGVLLGRVAVPDGDEVGVEADGEANAADLVGYVTKELVFFSCLSSHFPGVCI